MQEVDISTHRTSTHGGNSLRHKWTHEVDRCGEVEKAPHKHHATSGVSEWPAGRVSNREMTASAAHAQAPTRTATATLRPVTATLRPATTTLQTAT